MSSEEQRLESKILYFEDMMFRYKGYEYQKVETIRKEISDMRIQLQRIRFKKHEKESLTTALFFFYIYPPRLFLPLTISNLE